VDNIAPISLSFLPSLLIFAFCIYIVYKGKVEYAIGIYLSSGMLGSGTIKIFSIPHFYVLVVLIIGSSFYYFNFYKKSKFFPRNNHWIILWIVFWFTWELILIQYGNSPYKSTILMSFVPRIIAPLPIIILFSNNIKKIYGFSKAYIITTLVLGLKIVFVNYKISLSVVLIDATFRSFGILFLNSTNYHWFSYPFAISLLLAIVLLISSQTIFNRLFYILSVLLCIYFIILSGSRQTIFGILIILIIFGIWLFRNQKSNISTILYALLGIPIFVFSVYSIYIWGIDVIVRSNEQGLLDSLDLIASRGIGWSNGIATFLRSPLAGSAFSMYGSHNLFIGTLAEQGIIGFVFLIGYLYFIKIISHGIFKQQVINEFSLLRMAFFCIILFGLIHSQASGSVVSVWHLFWPAPFLWHLKTSLSQNNLANKWVM
jgi:hypothetical protein